MWGVRTCCWFPCVPAEIFFIALCQGILAAAGDGSDVEYLRQRALKLDIVYTAGFLLDQRAWKIGTMAPAGRLYGSRKKYALHLPSCLRQKKHTSGFHTDACPSAASTVAPTKWRIICHVPEHNHFASWIFEQCLRPGSSAYHWGYKII